MEVISVVGMIMVVVQMIVMMAITFKIDNLITASLLSWLGLFFAGMAIAIALSGLSVAIAAPLMSGAMMNVYLFMHLYLKISR